MKTPLKMLLIPCLLVAFSSESHAKKRKSEIANSTEFSTPTPSSGTSGSARKLIIGGGLGFFGSSGGLMAVDDKSLAGLNLSGLIGIAAEADFPIREPLFAGAHFRYYTTSDDHKTGTVTTTYRESLWTLGGHGKVTFFSEGDFSGTFGFGLGLVSGTSKSGSAEEIAPGIGFGLNHSLEILYRVNANLQVGVENFRLLGLGTGYNGWLLSDFMLKARFQM